MHGQLIAAENRQVSNDGVDYLAREAGSLLQVTGDIAMLSKNVIELCSLVLVHRDTPLLCITSLKSEVLSANPDPALFSQEASIDLSFDNSSTATVKLVGYLCLMPVYCLQHSSLWARSPLFEATLTRSQGIIRDPGIAGSVISQSMMRASSWQHEVVFEETQTQLPLAPTITEAASPWRGNAAFDSTRAASTAPDILPRPEAQPQDMSLKPNAGPLLAPPAAPAEITQGPSVRNGVFKDSNAQGKGLSCVPGQPFMQQLGANQSAGPVRGLPSGGGAGASGAAQHSARQQALTGESLRNHRVSPGVDFKMC